MSEIKDAMVYIFCAFVILYSLSIPMLIGLPILVMSIFFIIIYATIEHNHAELIKSREVVASPKIKKYCFMCGKIIDHEKNFCKHCGTNLKLRGKNIKDI